jgi:HK97 family phage prohead protease
LGDNEKNTKLLNIGGINKMKNFFIKECGENLMPKFIDEQEKTIVHYITTKSIDRFGDKIYPEGMNDEDYRKNPVVLFAHDSREMTIGKNIWLKKDKKGVLAKTQFADTNIGRDLFRLNKNGFLNAWSIGFIIPEDGSEYVDGVNHIRKWNLLEYSSVPLPANPESLNLMLKEVSDDKLKKYLQESYESVHYELIRMSNHVYDRISELEKKFDRFENVVTEKFLQVRKVISD